MLGEKAKRYTELRESWRQLWVDPDEMDVTGRTGVGKKAMFAERNGDADDGDHSQQRHLKAGLEEAAGRERKDAEDGSAD